MADDKLTEHELDALFDAARARPVQPDAGWLARVAEDAALETALRVPVPAPSLWTQIRLALGGWQGVGGMAMAGCAGLWIGFAPPAVVGDPLTRALGGEDTVDLLSDAPFEYAVLLDEG
ncbi:MAG: hypothetical protein WAO69_08825 [Aestuariivita sp.]|uniref:hypothetical protein n=1 Tax=Aestuariivita sp. TaxID=1872407 RepID=UPI003BB14D78